MGVQSLPLAALGAVVLLPLVIFLEGCGTSDQQQPPTTTIVPEDTTTAAPHSTTDTAINASRRLGSFLVIGDWGWDPQVHGQISSRTCQQAIADAMGQKARELGDVKFVVNVGDSFYPDGVANRSDPAWASKWRDVYPEEVRAVPWYSVYGNHDYHKDPCVCSENLEDCAQVNGNASDLDYFYMPNTSWYRDHPELDMEVVALDTNYLWVEHTCRWTPCPDQCQQNLKLRMEAALGLFYNRTRVSRAQNLLVFSHYPTDYFWGHPDFLAELSNATERRIEYFGGHRHNVDQSSCTSIAPNNNWLVGGGGGWGCEHYGQEQGFVVGEIGPEGVRTYPVLVNYSLCC
uniref:Calcineurin-like phosphoesterase domain-containing protein n=1 Tax=Alexandrium andersonii TaxID=327968 RepID=A0A7S2CTJ1_9DINO|mmetsp:Transcript_42939/g.97468  ORF Transcript_42939/g.97468 Transcript_42939/m.97468 type:complete len:345 (+) Transcript_42939:111-1145(+)